MDHQDEYFDNLVTMLELIWGEGYMTPGGSDNVEKMFNGIETAGKRILDIGCGLGGQAFEMANTFGADVVGIDLEAPLIKRATEAATKMGLQDRCKFRIAKAGALDFPDQSFDIVATSGAITQVSDKEISSGNVIECLNLAVISHVMTGPNQKNHCQKTCFTGSKWKVLPLHLKH